MRARLGKTYWETHGFLKDAETWDAERIQVWQTAQLRRMVAEAYENTPGYRQLYDEAGVSPGDIRTPADLARLPFVTKELIRDNLADFTSRAVPERSRLHRTTGGSTGIPFGFYLTQDNIEQELAFIHRAWESVGWTLGDSSAVLRGAFVGSETELWGEDPVFRELKLSTYRLTEATYPKFRDKLLRSAPRHLQAYPSSAAILADLVIGAGDEGRLPFALLLLGSENLYDWQRERIRRAFPESRQFSWYGHAEQVLFAPACAGSSALHFHPFYGLVEILDGEDLPVGEGSLGELVGTSFWMRATPFIRYRTRDMAVRGPVACDACGRPFPLVERIEGRRQEFVVTGTGRHISMTQINMHTDVFDHVAQFQFHQTERGAVTLNLVRKPGYSDTDTSRIRSDMEEKLGEDMTLALAFVDCIGPLPSGKRGFLRQDLTLERGVG